MIIPGAELSESILLSEADGRHIVQALRLREGDRLIIADGNGREAVCALTSERRAAVLEVTPSRGEPLIPVHLYPSLSKGERFEWLLQKAAELGAVSITPVLSERCVAGLPSPGKLERFRRILRSAAEQSGRGIIPELRQPSTYHAAADAARGLRVFCYEEEKTVPLKSALDKIAGEVSVLTGPEGGYTPEEDAYAAQNGWQPVSLGNTILRCETAPLMVLSAIRALC